MILGMICGAHGEMGYFLFGGGVKGLLAAMVLGFAIVWLIYKLAPKVSSKIYNAPQA